MLRIEMDYAPREAELEVLQRHGASFDSGRPAPEDIVPLDREALRRAREAAAAVHVADALAGYVLDLACASREHPRLALGLSTRGALALLRAARIAAGLRGAAHATPDDVKRLAPAVVAHRLVASPESRVEGVDAGAVLTELLERTPVPR
jgi:MoxR-like ATPase